MNRIFVIEDEAIMRDMLKLLLERTSGLTVSGIASSGSEALRLWAHEEVDLTLLDLTLPDTPGLDILQELKNRAPDCRIVILSGDHRPEVRESVRQAGADGFILKGDPADIIHGIRDVLEGKHRLTSPEFF